MHILGLLKEHRYATGESSLPGIRTMAYQCSVSPTTMARALHSLAMDNVIEVEACRRARVRGVPSPSPALEGSLWTRTSQALSADILDGVFLKEWAIPQCGDLARRYQVNYRTMRKALEHCARDLGLHRQGRSWKLPVTETRRPTASIVLIGGRRLFSDAFVHGSRLVAEVESQCAGAHLKLIRCVYDDYGESPMYEFPGREPTVRLPSDPACMGFVVAEMNIENMDALLRRLSKKKLPISLWLIRGAEMKDMVGAGDPERVRRFSTTISSEAGRQLGFHLRSLGHQRIAYLSPFHASTWSMDRVKGLRQAFAGNGKKHSVLECVENRFPHAFAMVQHDRFPQAEIRRLLQPLLTSGRKRVELASGRASLNAAAREINSRLTSILEASQVALRVESLAEQAATDQDVSAWVCANDAVAVRAFEYLHRRGLQNHISILGFDNTPESVARDITSYDFDLEGLARKMVAYILFNQATADSARQHSGFLVERSSSHRVSGKKVRP